MPALWNLDSTQIFVNEYDEQDAQIMARLQPLSGASITHIWGYEKPIYSMKGVVIGNTDKNSIKGMYDDGSTHTVSGPYGINTTVYVKSLSIKLRRSVTQTVRQDLAADSPVYVVEAELWES